MELMKKSQDSMNLMGLPELTLEQKSMLMQMWEREMIHKIANDVNEVKKITASHGDEIERLKHGVEQSNELAKTSMALKSHQYGFVAQKDIGYALNPSVGSKTVGTLLRIIGIARIDLKDTTPCREAMNNNYATSEPNPNGYTCFYYNCEKVLVRLDKWLNQNNEYNIFYNHKTADERSAWIKNKAEELGIKK